MITQPHSCLGCALSGHSQGFMHPEGHAELGVAIMGEALWEAEAKTGKPFQGPAGFRFEKMLERAGFKRDQFLLLNAASCRPMTPRPNAEPPTEAIDHCRPNWEHLVYAPEVKVIVPMGNAALYATLGSEGILSKRGYVWWSDDYDAFILPTVHPSYIMRGNNNWEAAWLYDLRHAVEVARDGWSPVQRDQTIDPNPLGAHQWAYTFVSRWQQDHTLTLAVDIETPDKSTAEDEVDINLGYLAGPIYRINFGYVWQGLTYCATWKWDPNYMAVTEMLLGLGCDLTFHYRHFDVPRIKAHGKVLAGPIHDTAEMWHTLHSDLPKKLEHITPFLVPNQPAWKHLNSGETAAFYAATDGGVQIECFYKLKSLLQTHGMWELYYRDIFGLNPILIYMNEQGMPTDVEKRKAASQKCMILMEDVRVKLNEAASLARPSKTYTQARFAEGLEEISIEKTENYCTECNKRVPNKGEKHPHFSCGTAPGEFPLGERQVRKVSVKAWIKPLDFKPSQKGLIRYAQFKGYKLISRWDKVTGTRKTSMDETAVRQYALKYTTDPLWPLVLDARELGKLLSTYIGRLTDIPEKEKKSAEAEWWEAFRRAENMMAYAPPDGLVRDRNPVHQKSYVPNLDDLDSDVPF